MVSVLYSPTGEGVQEPNMAMAVKAMVIAKASVVNIMVGLSCR